MQVGIAAGEAQGHTTKLELAWRGSRRRRGRWWRKGQGCGPGGWRWGGQGTRTQQICTARPACHANQRKGTSRVLQGNSCREARLRVTMHGALSASLRGRQCCQLSTPLLQGHAPGATVHTWVRCVFLTPVVCTLVCPSAPADRCSTMRVTHLCRTAWIASAGQGPLLREPQSRAAQRARSWGSSASHWPRRPPCCTASFCGTDPHTRLRC